MIRGRGRQCNAELGFLEGVGPSNCLGDLVDEVDLCRQWQDRRIELIDAHTRHVDRRRVQLAELRCPRKLPAALLIGPVLDL